MKKLFFLSVLSLLSCSQKTNPETEWTKNGNLHDKTIIEWKSASDQNKLATCADFMASLKRAENQTYTSIQEMKFDANNLKVCIDEGTADNKYADYMKVREIAVTCYILMKAYE
ncbi:hypothetical protein H5J24_03870 [Chryseobacterium capnotolerans]|uniref:hypothetical protein n=1 Tax=Chryseobacterium TaxID=59732 RepID=UPI001E602E84|nr:MULTISPECIES: hypothetical protein [Chryseobacterium]UHO39268.1 hypothetical protein H5J24_03870 [Chryseobacterium capnotolerans]